MQSTVWTNVWLPFWNIYSSTKRPQSPVKGRQRDHGNHIPRCSGLYLVSILCHFAALRLNGASTRLWSGEAHLERGKPLPWRCAARHREAASLSLSLSQCSLTLPWACLILPLSSCSSLTSHKTRTRGRAHIRYGQLFNRRGETELS